MTLTLESPDIELGDEIPAFDRATLLRSHVPLPGPAGARDAEPALDLGTLARTASPLPGPMGLQLTPGIFLQVRSAKPRLKSRGLTVHSASQISARAWVKKIRASDHVPTHYQDQLKSKGSVIYVKNPLKFRVPSDVIPRDWREDWLSVFVTDGKHNTDWELTTGHLAVTVEKGDADGPRITAVHSPDLSKGESLTGFTKHTMTSKGRSTRDVSIERGNTLPTGAKLKSGRKLIVIANRITLKLGAATQSLKFTDDELVEVWFHETAAHAGRNSRGLPDIHGDKEVESRVREIEEMFPKSVTVPKVNAAIKAFLKP